MKDYIAFVIIVGGLYAVYTGAVLIASFVGQN
jgi:hypothetical protein